MLFSDHIYALLLKKRPLGNDSEKIITYFNRWNITKILSKIQEDTFITLASNKTVSKVKDHMAQSPPQEPDSIYCATCPFSSNPSIPVDCLSLRSNLHVTENLSVSKSSNTDRQPAMWDQALNLGRRTDATGSPPDGKVGTATKKCLFRCPRLSY